MQQLCLVVAGGCYKMTKKSVGEGQVFDEKSHLLPILRGIQSPG